MNSGSCFSGFCWQTGHRPSSRFSIGYSHLLLVLSLLLVAPASMAAQDGSNATASSPVDAQQVTLQTPWRSSLPPAAIGFTGWNGWSTSPRNLENNAQAILSEPEVERFIQELIRRIGGLPRQAMGDAPPAMRRAASRLMTNVVESFLLRSGCLYLERFVPPSEGKPPVVEACAWLEIGPQADTILADLKTLLADAPTEIIERQIDGQAFLAMDASLGPETLIFVGVVDQCLVVSISENCLSESLKRKAAGKTPNWLSNAEAKHGLAQLQGLGHFDFAKLWAQMLPALVEMGMGEQELAVIRNLGLERLQSIETVDGFAQRHRIQRIQVNVEPGTGGIWSLFQGPGLRPENLQHMASDTLFSYAVAVDLKGTLRYVEQFINQIDGADSNPVSEFYEGLYEETGVDLEEDVLDPLGDAWTIHNAAGDGWFSGLALTVSVKDAEALTASLTKLIDAYSRETAGDPDMGKITTRKLGELNVFTMSFPSGPIPILPSWTIHDDRLIVALFPETLPAMARSPDSSLVSSSAEIQEIFATDGKAEAILMFSYVDMQRQFEVMYPYAQMLLAMGSNAVQSFPMAEAESFGEVINGLLLPPSRVIHRHLLPTTTVLKRNASGFQWESRSTFPTADVTVMAPVAVGLLLPAVQQARDAARRTQSQNNLHNIVLACHNYHDSMGRFPAAFSQSDDKEPLLSWRVHILPYLEQQNLYDRFKLDEPWDSPHNLALLELMPDLYRGANSQAPPGYTVYLGVTGKDAPFGMPSRTGQGSAASGYRFADFVDGSSNTIMGLEVSDELAVPWTKPDSDINIAEFDSNLFYGQFPGGVNAFRADGSVEMVGPMPNDIWKIFFQINDGQVPPMLNSDW
ncbi:MAG: DUF1559 domain-containing protein [Pirellulaceae bacterium]|nr:DUF1559 domain-containing protein [Pirellulaceae bacterium]